MSAPQRTVSLHDIAAFLSAELPAGTDCLISGLSSLEQASERELSFLTSDRFLKKARASKAAAFVVAKRFDDLPQPQLVVPHPALACARLAQEFFAPPYEARGLIQPVVQGDGLCLGEEVSIGPFVTIGRNVTIGHRVTLAPGVYVGDDCQIGDDCHLHPNVVVEAGCRLGQRVIIHGGTVVGSDGFGYVQHEGAHVKVPQLGHVVIEDDVEIGANVTIDRATFGQTRIGRGTKVDNLVQLAHNVQIGPHCIVVAQVGVAGSTTVGTYVMIGGQAGLADHLDIGDRVMIAARAGVNRSLSSDQIVSGTPAMPHETALRAQALLPHLPELRQQLRELQKRVDSVEQSLNPGATPRTKRKR